MSLFVFGMVSLCLFDIKMCFFGEALFILRALYPFSLFWWRIDLVVVRCLANFDRYRGMIVLLFSSFISGEKNPF